MIVNITKGASASGGIAYDYSPGKREEHINPHRVGGNVAGRTAKVRGAMIDKRTREYVETKGRKPKDPIIRLAVAANKEDRLLTDQQWGQIARETVDRFTKGNADHYLWEAVRHDPRHIHITLSRVGADGKLLASSNDYRRAQSIGRALEKAWNLKETPGRVFGKKSKEKDTKQVEHKRQEDRTEMDKREPKSFDERRQELIKNTIAGSKERREGLKNLREEQEKQERSKDRYNDRRKDNEQQRER